MPSVKFGDPCPLCGCTGRTGYVGTRKVPIGQRNTKQEFYVIRYTKCKRCGHKRRELRIEVPE